MPWNQFTEFCQVCLLQDNSTMKLKDIDTLFIATNVPSERARVVQTQARKSGNVLVRFEFLESIVRLAKKKFFNTGAAPNYADAVEMLLKNHILPLGPHEDVIDFRETHLCVRVGGHLRPRVRLANLTRSRGRWYGGSQVQRRGGHGVQTLPAAVGGAVCQVFRQACAAR